MLNFPEGTQKRFDQADLYQVFINNVQTFNSARLDHKDGLARYAVSSCYIRPREMSVNRNKRTNSFVFYDNYQMLFWSIDLLQ